MHRHQINNNADLIVSIDDYHEDNVPLAMAFADIGITGTFFIECLTPGALQQMKELHKLGMKLGSHTLHHPPDIKMLAAEECRAELASSKRMIEEITGEQCLSLAYPRGRFNDDVVSIAEECGYVEARTTHVLKTEMPDPMRAGTTIHVYDGRKEYNGRPWRVMADFHLEHVIRRGGTFHIWGHAREMLRDNQTDALLEFLETIKLQP